jgi:DNA-binding MarR family transcriptional regulator
VTDTGTLARDIRVLVAQLRRQLRAQADGEDYTPSQVAVIKRLDAEGALGVTELAHAEGVRSQSMGATVAALEQLGVVERSADPADGRRSLVSLTADFRDRLLANRASKEDWLAARLDALFTAEERDAIAHAVAALARLAAD